MGVLPTKAIDHRAVTRPRLRGSDASWMVPFPVGLVRRNCGHYVENDLVFVETFRADHYEEVSLANWLAHLPPKLVSAHLNIPEDTLATFPRGAQGIVPLP